MTLILVHVPGRHVIPSLPLPSVIIFVHVLVFLNLAIRPYTAEVTGGGRELIGLVINAVT